MTGVQTCALPICIARAPEVAKKQDENHPTHRPRLPAGPVRGRYRRLWNDPRKSFACALVYMTFGLIACQAGYSNLDPQFTLWVNLSLVALWFAVDTQDSRQRLFSWALLGFACGMGFMTKGFLALLLPVLIALPYMIWRESWVSTANHSATKLRLTHRVNCGSRLE